MKHLNEYIYIKGNNTAERKRRAKQTQDRLELVVAELIDDERRAETERDERRRRKQTRTYQHSA